jgi:signal transduction histidine kinase
MPSAAIASPLRALSLVHDLKNLMTVVVSATEALALAENGGTDRRALVEASLEAARRGAALLRDLLAGHAPAPQSPQGAACAETLETAARLVIHALPTDVSLSVSACEPRLACQADREELDAALMNLCKNAGEACTAGGAVTLSAASVSPAQAWAEGLDARDYVCFEVRDTGAGLSPELLARALQGGFTTKPGGSGLGLVSVSAFARSCGGALRVASAPGQGCRVSLYLPRFAALAEAA